MPFPFLDHTLEQRQSIVARARHRRAVPCLIDMVGVRLSRQKYLVPDGMSLGQVMVSIRYHNGAIPSAAGIYVTIDGVMVTTTQLVSSLYSKYQAPDGFLYLTLVQEATFG